MAQLSAEELLFLSNLMHIKNETPFSEIWKEEYVGKEGIDIGELIKGVDIQKLETEYGNEIFDGEISGAEWAAMLEKIKQNENICDLRLVDLEQDDKNALSVCLHNDKTGETYVVFRGTSAGEWPDNFEGGYVADTEQQRSALAFVERQDYDNITVVGHSKGGNKAKYVALLSDKVEHCFSFDGQGFSPAFLEKYGPLIEVNKSKITCYALDFDFVNILLTDIYNEKFYVDGYGVDNFAQNHSPNSFFNSQWKFDVCDQSDAMADMHKFINYIINTGDTDEVAALMDYLGNVVNFLMGKQPPDYTEKYSAEELRKYLLDPENSEELGLLIAYIVQYESTGDKITNAIFDILWKMDGDFFEQAKLKALALLLEYVDEKVGLEVIIANIEKYGDWLSVLLLQFGVLESEEEAAAIMQALRIAGQKQGEIPLPGKANCKDQTISRIKRDFSDEMRTTLLNLTEEVENEEFWDFSKWDVWYRLEDWCGHLNVEHYKNNIQDYYRKVIDINDTTVAQMQKIFQAIDQLDLKYGQIFEKKAEEFAKITKEVRSIMA